MAKSISFRFLWVLLVPVLLGSCSLLDSDEDTTRVRVENASEYPMTEVSIVFPPGQELDFGTNSPGDASNYMKVSEAWGLARIEAFVEGSQLVVQPIDYVGAQPLSPGDYTFELHVVVDQQPDSPDHLSLAYELKSE